MVFTPSVENVIMAGSPSLHKAACGSALPGTPVIRRQNCTVRVIQTQWCVTGGTAGKRKDGESFFFFFAFPFAFLCPFLNLISH